MITTTAKMRNRDSVQPQSQPEAGPVGGGQRSRGWDVCPCPTAMAEQGRRDHLLLRLQVLVGVLAATRVPVPESARRPGTGRTSPPRCLLTAACVGTPPLQSPRIARDLPGFQALRQTFKVGCVHHPRRTRWFVQIGHEWAVELSSGSRGSCQGCPFPTSRGALTLMAPRVLRSQWG